MCGLRQSFHPTLGARSASPRTRQRSPGPPRIIRMQILRKRIFVRKLSPSTRRNAYGRRLFHVQHLRRSISDSRKSRFASSGAYRKVKLFLSFLNISNIFLFQPTLPVSKVRQNVSVSELFGASLQNARVRTVSMPAMSASLLGPGATTKTHRFGTRSIGIDVIVPAMRSKIHVSELVGTTFGHAYSKPRSRMPDLRLSFRKSQHFARPFATSSTGFDSSYQSVQVPNLQRHLPSREQFRTTPSESSRRINDRRRRIERRLVDGDGG